MKAPISVQEHPTADDIRGLVGHEIAPAVTVDQLPPQIRQAVLELIVPSVSQKVADLRTGAFAHGTPVGEAMKAVRGQAGRVAGMIVDTAKPQPASDEERDELVAATGQAIVGLVEAELGDVNTRPR